MRHKATPGSHYSQQSTTSADYIPSDDEGTPVDLDPEDDDGFAMMSWSLPKRRNSRVKKNKPWQWYDENRIQPEEGFCLRMCFLDVYQFSRALPTYTLHKSRTSGIYHQIVTEL